MSWGKPPPRPTLDDPAAQRRNRSPAATHRRSSTYQYSAGDGFGDDRHHPRFVHDGKLLVHRGSVYDKLTDPALFTGSSKARFDEQGRGRGIEGRDTHSLYGLAAAAAIHDTDALPYGDDRDCGRWSSSLRATFYSRIADQQSRMRRAELLHEREVASRGKIWRTAPLHEAPAFEHWELDPNTGELRRDDERTAELMYGPSDTWPRPPVATPPPPSDLPVLQPPPPPSAASVHERRWGASGDPAEAATPPRRYEDDYRAQRTVVAVTDELPPRTLAPWELRELRNADLLAPGTSAAAIPGALPAWEALRERTALRTPATNPPPMPTVTSGAAIGLSAAAQFTPYASDAVARLAGNASARAYHGPAAGGGPVWIDDPSTSGGARRPPTIEELMGAVEAQSRFTY